MVLQAKELMIGDFIRIKGKPWKVSYIAPFDIGDARLAVISNDYDGNPYLSDIEPIPLTIEILEANGWELLSFYNREAYYAPNGVFSLDLRNGLLRLIIHGKIIIIQYVHELQRALRLCGLNELADNFKIE